MRVIAATNQDLEERVKQGRFREDLFHRLNVIRIRITSYNVCYTKLLRTMPLVARESGAFDRLLRPLCAKLLPPTLPEREGWVQREKLLGLNGRNRKPQILV